MTALRLGPPAAAAAPFPPLDAAPDRVFFLVWMADRLQAEVPGLSRDRAARCALALLEARLAAIGTDFGHPDHDWDEPAAWALVDLDLSDNPFDLDLVPFVRLERV